MPDKAMACIRAALSPAAKAVYKYSLGLTEDDQKKPHMVLNALREYYGASIGALGNDKSSFACYKTKTNQSLPGRREYAINQHSVNMKISLTSLRETSSSPV